MTWHSSEELFYLLVIEVCMKFEIARTCKIQNIDKHYNLYEPFLKSCLPTGSHIFIANCIICTLSFQVYNTKLE